MTFIQEVAHQAVSLLPQVLMAPLLLIPFIVAEQIWPARGRPRFKDYGLNVLISTSTAFLVLPLGMTVAAGGAWLGESLPWSRLSVNFETVSAVPYAGGFLKIVAMIAVPLFIHDLWFYWAHRIEHAVPFLWEFHKLHHSDERLNCATFGRDHFLQALWIAVFPTFTLGLVFDLSLKEAGQAALYSNLFLIFLSMFYHSAIRVHVPWLDRILVTPQVHRIHHSTDPQHYNANFADALPLFDILFGTYRLPRKGEFPATGLGEADFEVRNLWTAQAVPVAAACRRLRKEQTRARTH